MWRWLGAVVAIIVIRALMLAMQPVKRRRSTQPASTMIVLGSGGHTAEMLKLLGTLQLQQYSPRSYVVASTDAMGTAKAQAFEQQQQKDQQKALQQAKDLRAAPATAAVDVIPRSREVGQSYLTSVLTTLRALATACGVVLRRHPDLLLVNGPGTCIPICAAALLFRFLSVAPTRIVYVESIARVASLSLSGLILYHCHATSALFVQWPALQKRYPRALYEGRLY